jgi:hypothetical protein
MLGHLVVRLVRRASAQRATHVHIADLHAVDVAGVYPSEPVLFVSFVLNHQIKEKKGKEKKRKKLTPP